LAEDDEYLEIALHGAAHRFSTVVVNYVLAPLLINLISSYLYDSMKAKPEDRVELAIVIEDHECRAMRVEYKGDAKDLVSVADKIGQMSRDCMDAEHTHHGSHTASTRPRSRGAPRNFESAPPAVLHEDGGGSASPNSEERQMSTPLHHDKTEEEPQ